MNSEQFLQKPDIKLSVKQTFGFDSDMEVGAFSKKNEYVPKIDSDYKFDKDTTLAILAAFSFKKIHLIMNTYPIRTERWGLFLKTISTTAFYPK